MALVRCDFTAMCPIIDHTAWGLHHSDSSLKRVVGSMATMAYRIASTTPSGIHCSLPVAFLLSSASACVAA